MKRRLIPVLFATVAAVMIAGSVAAQSVIDSMPTVSIPAPEKNSTTAGEVVEGYARPDYRDMIQTIVVLGGLDINKPAVAEEYARLIECTAYRKYHADDFSWNGIRQQVVERVRSKKENYRIHYEYPGLVKLDRYDFAKQTFPLTPDTRFNNVGRMDVVTQAAARPYLCRTDSEDKKDPYFPMLIGLTLNTPLDLKGFAMAPEQAEALLAKLKARGVADRSIFVRFRFRVVDQPKIITDKKGIMHRAELIGNIEHIDFFLDRDLTAWIASVPVKP